MAICYYCLSSLGKFGFSLQAFPNSGHSACSNCASKISSYVRTLRETQDPVKRYEAFKGFYEPIKAEFKYPEKVLDDLDNYYSTLISEFGDQTHAGHPEGCSREDIIHQEKLARDEALHQEKLVRDAEKAAKARALSSMLITSGFQFDGYRITKYSGYISGDDAISVNRGTIFSSTSVSEKLMDSLVIIRRNALRELKEAAYDLGCNAVIGVDFDYLTLEPETAGLGTTYYQPYVFGVTANGNAVVIEKIEDGK